MKTSAIIFTLSLNALSLLHAQDATASPQLPPIPPGPLIQDRAPDFAQWVVTTSQDTGNSAKGQGSATPPASKSSITFGSVVTVTKTGKIKLRETLDEKGNTWPTWCVKNTLVTVRPDTGGIIVNSGLGDPRNPSPFGVDYSATDFPEIPAGVVSLANYAGIQTEYDKQCLIFKGKAAPNAITAPMPYTAYIDLKTRYPVAVVAGVNVRKYEFHAPPTTELELPPVVLQVFKNIEIISRGGRQ